MDDLSPGWATGLAILRHTGSTIDDRGDHLVLRTPANPDFHWGNALVVRAADRVGDAEHWAGVFAAEFPAADWLTVALPRLPADPGPWTAIGAVLELDEVLTTRTCPRLPPAPPGYAVRVLDDATDWEQQVGRSLRDNLTDGRYDPAAHERFVRAEAAIRRDLCDRGQAAWFGAFTPEDRLVADLGIVLCGPDARYQAVGTDAEHRRRGIAGHLLGAAAGWAADRGARRWVIVTEATNPAGRVYRAVGFEPDAGDAQAYRPPARP